MAENVLQVQSVVVYTRHLFYLPLSLRAVPIPFAHVPQKNELVLYGRRSY